MLAAPVPQRRAAVVAGARLTHAWLARGNDNDGGAPALFKTIQRNARHLSVLNRTAVDLEPRYRRRMQLQNKAVILAAVYVAVVGISGAVAGITSASAWVSLVSVALLSACSMLIVWSQPLQTAPALPVVRR